MSTPPDVHMVPARFTDGLDGYALRLDDDTMVDVRDVNTIAILREADPDGYLAVFDLARQLIDESNTRMTA